MLTENQKKSLAELAYQTELSDQLTGLNDQLQGFYDILASERGMGDCRTSARILEAKMGDYRTNARILEAKRETAANLLEDDYFLFEKSLDAELERARARRVAEKIGRELVKEYSARVNALLEKLTSVMQEES